MKKTSLCAIVWESMFYTFSSSIERQRGTFSFNYTNATVIICPRVLGAHWERTNYWPCQKKIICLSLYQNLLRHTEKRYHLFLDLIKRQRGFSTCSSWKESKEYGTYTTEPQVRSTRACGFREIMILF